MKNLIRQIRTYDTDGYRLRAGCLCYKNEEKKELLLVSSKKGWVVPAGGIDPGETAVQAAVREVREEGGVVGDVGNCMGVFRDAERKTVTYVYAMIVRQMVNPLEQKTRKWFCIKDAINELKGRPSQQSYITTNVTNCRSKGKEYGTSGIQEFVT